MHQHTVAMASEENNKSHMKITDLIGEGDKVTQLAATFSRLENMARRLFEREEFLASARSWKKAASIGKKMGRDDYRSLAYKHLSFALRGCGQVKEADEAFRRAVKYEQRAAPNNSPSKMNGGGSSYYMSDSTDNGSGLEYASQQANLQFKPEKKFLSKSSTYVSGGNLQSLAEVNASLRDKVEALEAALESSHAATKASEDRAKQFSNELLKMRQSLKIEEETCFTLKKQISELSSSGAASSKAFDHERQAHLGTIESLQSKLEAEQQNAMDIGDKYDLLDTKMSEILKENSRLKDTGMKLQIEKDKLTSESDALKEKQRKKFSEQSRQ